MALSYAPGYSGEDLHVIRNGVGIDIKQYFNLGGATPVITFYFPGALVGEGAPVGHPLQPYANRKITGTYEYVNFDSNGVVTANLYVAAPSMNHPELSCVYCIIAIGTDFRLIIIYLHDYVVAVWLTPNPITIRPNYGTFRAIPMLKFNDGLITQAAHYRGMTWAASTGSTGTIVADATVTGGFKLSATPSTLPYTGDIVLTLPATLVNGTGSPASPTTVSASVSVLADSSVTTLISGNKGDREGRRNILIISDGFTAAESTNFTNCATDLVSFMKNSNVAIPYKQISNKLNLWSHFIPSASSNGYLPGMYVKLNPTAASPTYLKLQWFINMCNIIYGRLRDAIILSDVQDIRNALKKEFPILEQVLPWPTTAPYISFLSNVDLQDVLKILGLPGAGEVGKTFDQRVADWTSMMTLPAGISLFEDSITTPTPTPLLHADNFIKNVWMMCRHVEWFNVPDTAFVSQRNFDDDQYASSDPKLNTGAQLYFAPVKFNKKIDFNKYVHGIKMGTGASQVSIGERFYTAAGENAADGDFVIIFSKIHNLQILGNLIPDNPLRAPGMPDLGNIVFVNAYSEQQYESPSMADPNSVNGRLPANVVLGSTIGYSSKHTAIHEFSHNFLLDEYSGPENTDYYDVENPYTPEFEVDIFDRIVLPSNLQPKVDVLGVDEGGVYNASAYNGEKIKWLWPRIKKIAITSADLEFDAVQSRYRFKLGAFNPLNLPPSLPIQVGDTLLLRNRDLFSDVPYLKFTLTSLQSGYYYLDNLNTSALSF